MRIREFHVYRCELPVKNGPYRMASTSVSSLDTTLAKIVTETGLVGYRESCPVGPVYQPMHALGVRSALEQMGPHLIGAEALHIGCVHDVMEAALNGYRYAKAAVDMVLWDVAGKAYGVRVCELLGGPRQERVPSYYALGVMAPDEAVHRWTLRPGKRHPDRKRHHWRAGRAGARGEPGFHRLGAPVLSFG